MQLYTVAVKSFEVTLLLIDEHLQQQNQVASTLSTGDFWLVVCLDTC